MEGMSHLFPCFVLQLTFFCSKLQHFSLFGLTVCRTHKLVFSNTMIQGPLEHKPTLPKGAVLYVGDSVGFHAGFCSALSRPHFRRGTHHPCCLQCCLLSAWLRPLWRSLSAEERHLFTCQSSSTGAASI